MRCVELLPHRHKAGMEYKLTTMWWNPHDVVSPPQNTLSGLILKLTKIPSSRFHPRVTQNGMLFKPFGTFFWGPEICQVLG